MYLLRDCLFYRGRRLLAVAVWFVLAAYVVFPALRTVTESFGLGSQWTLSHYRDFFSMTFPPSAVEFFRTWDWLSGSPSFSPGVRALYGSLSISILSVLGAAVLGVPLAFFLERNDFPGRTVMAPLMLLPLTLPPVVGVVSFDLLFSESGIGPRGLAYLLGYDSPPIYLSEKAGIVAVHSYSLFPFFYLLVSGALRDLDGSLVEASRSLGLGPSGTFFRVVAPMLTPAFFGASVMVFMISMASFSAPLLFDVDGMYLSTYIYNLKNQNLLVEAYAATTIFAVASLGMLVLLRFLKGSKRYQSVGKGVPRRRPAIRSVLWRTVATFFGFGFLFAILLPHLAILLWSFTQDGTWTYQILPPKYTLENYAYLLGASARGATVFEPVRNSLWMAGLATVGNLALGIGAAFLLKSRGVRGKAATDLMVMLPWALPGTVIAVNLLVTFNGPSVLMLGASLANSVFLLPMAYFIRNIPLVVRPLVAAWESSGPEIEEAARVLGSGRLRMLRTVSLPMVFPALVAGGLLAFVTALGEFMASAILYTPRNKPISMAIFSEFHSGAYGVCSAYGVLLILLIAVVMILGRKTLSGPAL